MHGRQRCFKLARGLQEQMSEGVPAMPCRWQVPRTSKWSALLLGTRNVTIPVMTKPHARQTLAPYFRNLPPASLAVPLIVDPRSSPSSRGHRAGCFPEAVLELGHQQESFALRRATSKLHPEQLMRSQPYLFPGRAAPKHPTRSLGCARNYNTYKRKTNMQLKALFLERLQHSN